MSEGFSLIEREDIEVPGDEWEEIDVADTEADRIARRRDREFNEFRKRIKDSETLKLEASVFDEATYGALYKLVQDGYIEAFGGPISTGKEANVYTALGPDQTEVAVKVYRINASDFKDMRGYLDGDPRFEGIGGDKKKVVLAWVKKEFANLHRAKQAGVRVPAPIATQRNVLVMEYLGTEDDRAKRLAEVDIENPETAFGVLKEYVKRLYRAGLVHGDLSEYNVLFHDGQLWILDLGQGVTIHHPSSREFLRRDCTNVAAFFTRQGYPVDSDAFFEEVVASNQSTPEASNGP